ncbi:CDP-diacylglycerol--serine O-phosphatidyltransferase [Pullulanibacillus pueri]|uniref:CDP-diacylglycerol--serine O-phosphatidyltransferase n=1 Tax=Pullulanibacillus pueri TaxID=1437324 RepID=A0A8J3ELK3_9BACL|nr:CDP-diacylglycerol--serine O-phosphatidyltransferase [Pullulanibacillus pueri]MBM7681625.1 CDP-diacylglycerol--serine O-phosphatidyltransferase [Pullulanibacillus pueri]GGH79406.1 CDP-diacylglycerol--serine O-phosphatidyltransferase [Pullulanibacillus pueri]
MIIPDRIDHTLKRAKAQSANAITIINLSLGITALVLIMEHRLHMSLVLIFLAALCDRFDGMVARKFDVESSFGKELDSLCDLVSFGIAPVMLIFKGIMDQSHFMGLLATILFILCGAIRLARFNVTEFDGKFQGLPITVAGCLLTLSFVVIHFLPLSFFVLLTIILSLLMISTFKINKI